jgi:hypothetical protein
MLKIVKYDEIKTLSKVIKITILLSLAILALSLTQPAFYIRNDNPEAWSNSLMLLMFGWTSALGGYIVGTIIWLANPLYFYSLYLLVKKRDNAKYIILLATGIAFIFSQLTSIQTNEAGGYSQITEFALGYKLWLTSFIVLLIGVGINELVKPKSE